jgi:hypothetical protein
LLIQNFQTAKKRNRRAFDEKKPLPKDVQLGIVHNTSPMGRITLEGLIFREDIENHIHKTITNNHCCLLEKVGVTKWDRLISWYVNEKTK